MKKNDHNPTQTFIEPPFSGIEESLMMGESELPYSFAKHCTSELGSEQTEILSAKDSHRGSLRRFPGEVTAIEDSSTIYLSDLPNKDLEDMPERSYFNISI